MKWRRRLSLSTLHLLLKLGREKPWMAEKPCLKSDAAGLFFTSLEPQQTTLDRQQPVERCRRATTEEDRRFDRLARIYEHEAPPADRVELAFRHRGWWANRQRVKAAMDVGMMPESRRRRFNNCGADCMVEVACDGSHHRLRAVYCGDRFCTPCCNARSRKIASALERWSHELPLSFLTLTLKATSDPLSKTVDRLLASFVKLRATLLWQKAVGGGAYFIEVTRGRRGSHWHVHLHVLFYGRWIDQRELSSSWHRSTGDSYVVDVRRINDRASACRYVAKYATKAIDDGVMKSPDALVEAMIALRGRRMLGTFGGWRGRRLDEDEPEKTEYRQIGKLAFVFHSARAGDEWAIGLLRSLGVQAVGDDRRPWFQPIDQEQSRPPPTS